MLRVFILGLFLLYPPLHAKEILKHQEYRSSRLEDLAEEMIKLNANLNSLSITLIKLLPKDSIQ